MTLPGLDSATPDRPTISVVMPNHNHAAYVEAALDGVLEQTRLADEVIVIDDASTDDSVDRIAGRLAGRPGCRLVRRAERGGAVASLNQGLSEATGDLLCFPAADDRLRPEFLERAEAALLRHPAAAFASAAVELWDAGGRTIGLRPAFPPAGRERAFTPEGFRRLLERTDNFLMTQVALFRRPAVVALGGFDPTLGPASDGLLARRLAARHGFTYMPEVLGAWRITGHNYSREVAMRPAEFEAMLSAVHATLTGEPGGLMPADYPETLVRRLRFGYARLAPSTAPGPVKALRLALLFARYRPFPLGRSLAASLRDRRAAGHPSARAGAPSGGAQR